MSIRDFLHKKMIDRSEWYRNKKRARQDWDTPSDKEYPVYPKINESYSYSGWEHLQTKLGVKYYRLSTTYDSNTLPGYRLEFESFDPNDTTVASHIGNNSKGQPLAQFSYLQWKTLWDIRYRSREEMMEKYYVIKDTLEEIIMESEL